MKLSVEMQRSFHETGTMEPRLASPSARVNLLLGTLAECASRASGLRQFGRPNPELPHARNRNISETGRHSLNGAGEFFVAAEELGKALLSWHREEQRQTLLTAASKSFAWRHGELLFHGDAGGGGGGSDCSCGLAPLAGSLRETFDKGPDGQTWNQA